MIPDDELTAEALALIEAIAERRTDVAAHVIAQYDTEELRRLVSKLLHLVDLRARVGADQPNTATWARWLREQNITL